MSNTDLSIVLAGIAKTQAASQASIEYPHRDPAWIPSAGVLSARIVQAPDAPSWEDFADLTEEEKAALPARFHTPVFDDLTTPNGWNCAVCWGDGWTTAWPCATAHEHGAEVFARDTTDYRQQLGVQLEQARRIAVHLENENARLRNTASSRGAQ